jgi:hypothetical protein
VRDTRFWGGVRKKETIFPVLKVPRQCPLVLLVEAAHTIGIRFFIIFLNIFIFYLFIIFFYVTPEGLHYREISTNIGRATLGRNFDVTNGRAAKSSSIVARRHYWLAPHRKHRFQQLLHCCVLHRRYCNSCFSASTILALSKYVTIALQPLYIYRKQYNFPIQARNKIGKHFAGSSCLSESVYLKSYWLTRVVNGYNYILNNSWDLGDLRGVATHA